MADVQAALNALQARKDQTSADLAKSEQTVGKRTGTCLHLGEAK